MSREKPVPLPTPETRPFWEACARDELQLQHCGRCASFFFPPGTACPGCGLDDEVAWARVSGSASLHSYVISHVAAPGYEEEVPFVVAVVELTEGPRLLSNVVGVTPEPDNLPLDMPLEVAFEPRGDLKVPVFRPAGAGPVVTAGRGASGGTRTVSHRGSRDASKGRPLVALVGVAETAEVGRQPERSALSLAAEASRAALADCRLTIADVDGIASAELSPVDLAAYMGLRPRWIDTTSVGGCSYLAHVRHAAAAIATGQASVVLVAHGESGRSGVGQPPWRRTPGGIVEQFEEPFGTVGPLSTFTIPAVRYLRRYGVTEEQLASVAVAQRRWATTNPRAQRRDPLSVEDVLSSRIIAYPFHLPECCLVTDGGGALVVVAAQRASDFPQPPVYVLGTGEGYEAPTVAQMEDLTTSRAFRESAGAAFAEAGLGPSDVDHLMVYDAFAHLPLYGLEDLGFVGRGEAGAFVEEGHTSPGGSLPMNTNGGGLSYTHTGMYGMFAIIEGARQLRGQASAQVEGVETSFVQGVGGSAFTAAGSLLLSNRLA